MYVYMSALNYLMFAKFLSNCNEMLTHHSLNVTVHVSVVIIVTGLRGGLKINNGSTPDRNKSKIWSNGTGVVSAGVRAGA